VLGHSPRFIYDFLAFNVKKKEKKKEFFNYLFRQIASKDFDIGIRIERN
jgi:hypothetical protein